ncbi:ATP-dependent helicase [Dickeya zeae]|uniref:ATP-dependent helicase n=1 Tax=Dickeya zeae TaxID=204042 RepID=UPI001F41A1CC|nr:ATP-dependent helicase [Dickeya zeae]UJR63015.1 ATP-dependent helicase [Dickeya zeae]
MTDYLSQAQKEVVEAPLGAALQVLASAGSGKTRVLTERVRHILNNSSRGSVIALTFTNKAADEMLERLDDGSENRERMWIATIHSVAQRVLESYGYTIGLPKELHIFERDQDRMEVFLQSLRKQGVNIDEYLDVEDVQEKRNREKIMSRYLTVFSVIKREFLNEDEVKEKYNSSPRIWNIYQDYQSALLESGGVDFDDILLYAHKILLSQGSVSRIYQKKYIALFVDEAQDLNRAQYEFIKALCGEKIKDVMMVGDSDQMIYGFNGSSSDFFIKSFSKDFSPVIYSLNENYRSSRAVIELANKIKPNTQVSVNAAIDGFKNLKALPDEESEAVWICDIIEKLIQLKKHPDIEGEIDFSKMVVIGRNRFVFKAIENEMEIRGIQHFLKRSDRNEEYVSLIGKVIDLAMRVKINPKDWVDGKKLYKSIGLNPSLEGGNTYELSEIIRNINKSNNKDKQLISLVLSCVEDLSLDAPNLLKFCLELKKELLKLGSITHDSSKEEDMALGISDIEQLQSMWNRFRRKGLGDNLSSFRNALALGQLNNESSNKGIMLSTVHTMKGLEKDIVFLVGMCEGVFPDYRAKSKIELDEERNSAFVAVTRSRRWIYVSYPEKRMMPWGDYKYHNASRFFIDMQ